MNEVIPIIVPLTVQESQRPIEMTVSTQINTNPAYLPTYDGEYTVVPQPFDATVLPTRNKAMQDDVIVTEIPYYTTTNEKGGYTAIIG